MAGRILVLGASGQIGRAALPRLRAAGFEPIAASRRVATSAIDMDGVRWQRIDLGAPASIPLPHDIDAVLSAGPLDLAAAWLADAPLQPRRIVAFSSTSAAIKARAVDAAERALAARLLASEQALLAWGRARNIAVTLLRPTLVYGAGLDRNLSRIAELARRFGWVVLPTHAIGLRQPVHADDLAAAAVSALLLAATPRARYDLPGGETLPYREMVARVLACIVPRPRLVPLPLPLLRGALALAHAAGALRDAHGGVLARMREDLVFDAAPAAADLGYTPRAFRVDCTMLGGAA